MYEKELEAAILAAKTAEKDILKIYHTDFEVEIKSDDSPVTKADKKADSIIRKLLAKEFPDHGFLTEESKDTEKRFSKEYVWIVDPVDGTKEFVSRNGQFTTNIALCRNHEIVVGVINVPTLGLTYCASKGSGAYRIEKDGTRVRLFTSNRTKSLRTMRSISFFNKNELAFYEAHKELFEGEPKPVGAALKFCRLAEGDFDFFFRGSPNTKEWDVAAGDIIVSEAGGLMVKPDFEPFKYNRVDVYNREGYLMANCLETLNLFK